MPLSGSPKAPVFFESAAAFRKWLERNAARESELLVGYHKVGTGKPSLSWSESVDEALCFGWIDGIRKSIDATAYQIRFTPRKKNSNWSAVNIGKVEALTKQGRMRPAGLEAFAARLDHKSGIYSYEQQGALKFSVEEKREFKRDVRAWQFFETTPPSYRKAMLYWLASAKQPATRSRRFAELLRSCAAGQRLLK